jgi:hypothetical protein
MDGTCFRVAGSDVKVAVQVEAPDVAAAKAAAAVQFDLDEVRRNKIIVQELVNLGGRPQHEMAQAFDAVH